MPEIKCPKCGQVFTVDESGYAEIVNQVRNTEFAKDLQERERQLLKDKDIEIKLLTTQAQAEKEKSLADLHREIEQLKAQINNHEQAQTLAVLNAVNRQKDEIAAK
ncbi:MAG: hypothetical protein Q4D11_06370, partial [Rhodospirillales bacterium]|nr:hypothetical protein [Rhodospirillales bacterium]